MVKLIREKYLGTLDILDVVATLCCLQHLMNKPGTLDIDMSLTCINHLNNNRNKNRGEELSTYSSRDLKIWGEKHGKFRNCIFMHILPPSLI